MIEDNEKFQQKYEFDKDVFDYKALEFRMDLLTEEIKETVK